MRNHHPHDRAERKRLAEARALEKLVPKKINAKKKHIVEDLLQQEAQDEIAAAYTGDITRVDQTVD